MNKYDELYTFRNAVSEDVDNIMLFLREYWDENHILATNKEFFLYHYGGKNQNIHVYLMEEKDTKKIAGINGYVLYSDDTDRRAYTGSITKVKPNLLLPMSGLELMKRLKNYLSPATEVGCGNNPATIVPLYKKVFCYDAGLMSQYYMLNRDIEDYKIITVPEKMRLCKETKANREVNVEIKRIESLVDVDFDYCRSDERLPYRSREYLQHRYFEHPIFDYQNYAIFRNKICVGIYFTRKIEYVKSAMSLIVDYVGDVDVIAETKIELEKLLKEENMECFSFLESGISDDVLRKGGFFKLNREDGVIIPTYFDPFYNGNILNHYIRENSEMIVLKGYGDQDNPRVAKVKK